MRTMAHGGIYLSLLVDDPVAEADDLACRVDGCLKVGEVPRGLVHGLAHYGKLPFDRPAEHAVLLVVGELPPVDKLDDGPAGVGDVHR